MHRLLYLYQRMPKSSNLLIWWQKYSEFEKCSGPHKKRLGQRRVQKHGSNMCKAHILSCLYCYYYQRQSTYWSCCAQADSVPAVELAPNGSSSLGTDGCKCWCIKTWPSPWDATLTDSMESPSFMLLVGVSTRGDRTVGDTVFKWSAVSSSPLHPESCDNKCNL